MIRRMSLPSDARAVGPAAVPEVHFYDVHSADGTRLRAWTNDRDHRLTGPTVLLCNGLGTNAWAWPALLAPGNQVRVVSWAHRGVGGSARPADRRRTGIAEFVEDAVAVLDDAGLDRVPALGWSMGVNTIFELASLHPERVSGLFAVAGVPGRTFSTMLQPTHLPRPVREVAALGLAHALRVASPLVNPVAHHVPVDRRTLALLRVLGFLGATPDPDNTARAVRTFLENDFGWYLHMALETSRHPRVPLSGIDVPAVLLGGADDLLAGTRDMATAAARLPQGRYVELPGSHFVAMERPDEVQALLLEWLDGLA